VPPPFPLVSGWAGEHGHSHVVSERDRRQGRAQQLFAIIFCSPPDRQFNGLPATENYIGCQKWAGLV
jgi:hypothetical protein